MKCFNKFSRPVLLSFAAAVLVGGTESALAAGGIKAAYVEQVIPAKTFSSSTVLDLGNNYASSIGPGTGIYGISSITLTNFSISPQVITIFVPVFASGGCGGSGLQISGSGEGPFIRVYVQPKSTLHFTYPTPLVINPLNGITCIAADVLDKQNAATVEFVVNGVVN